MLLHIISSRMQSIHMELVSKIDTFVREGVTDTREMKRLLKIIIKTEIFKNENLQFLSQKMKQDSIQEALSIMKSWNKDVSPIYGMTDYCNE